MRCALLLLATASLAISMPARAEPPAGAVLDAELRGVRLHVALSEIARRPVLGAGESFRGVEVGRDEQTSHHAVAIRDREEPHRHDRHDLLVVILRGHGTMRLGDETRPVGPGSILYVPRGTVHAFRNLADVPAVAYAVYSPPFDGEDRVAAE